jgi:hypothetical protein
MGFKSQRLRGDLKRKINSVFSGSQRDFFQSLLKAVLLQGEAEPNRSTSVFPTIIAPGVTNIPVAVNVRIEQSGTFTLPLVDQVWSSGLTGIEVKNASGSDITVQCNGVDELYYDSLDTSIIMPNGTNYRFSPAKANLFDIK